MRSSISSPCFFASTLSLLLLFSRLYVAVATLNEWKCLWGFVAMTLRRYCVPHRALTRFRTKLMMARNSSTEQRAPAALSAASFPSFQRMVLLRQQIDKYKHSEEGAKDSTVSYHQFHLWCSSVHIDTQEALAKLENAGSVVALSSTLLHLRPLEYAYDSFLMKVSTEREYASLSYASSITTLEHQIGVLRDREAVMRRDLQFALKLSSVRGRQYFSMLSLLLAAQLAMIMRLTFVELSWDVMEPISYCLSVVTSLALYIFYVRYGEEYSSKAAVSHMIPAKVRRYAPKNFDWEEYERVCCDLREREDALRRLRAFVVQC